MRRWQELSGGGRGATEGALGGGAYLSGMHQNWKHHPGRGEGGARFRQRQQLDAFCKGEASPTLAKHASP